MRTTGRGRLQKHRQSLQVTPYIRKLSLFAMIREIIGWGTRTKLEDDDWICLPGTAKYWETVSPGELEAALSTQFSLAQHQKALDLVLARRKGRKVPKAWANGFDSGHMEMDCSLAV